MNLYLMGARGSGKSTIAGLVGKRLGWKTIDTDREIESVAQKSIARIFAEDGEPLFREWEKTVIAAIALLDQRVVALGGGAVVDEENRQTLRSSGKTVWLQASPETLWQRIASDLASETMRPPLSSLEGIDEVRQVLDARHDVYAGCADHTVETEGRLPSEIADDIVTWFQTVDNNDDGR